MEVADGNDGALAAGIALAATMQSFVCTHETSRVGTNMAHIILNSSTQENEHLTKQKRAGPRGGIEFLVVGLTWIYFQRNCYCDSHSSYSYIRSFPSRPRFPVKHSVLWKYNTYYVTAVVLKLEVTYTLFSDSLWKTTVRRQHKPSRVPAKSVLEVTPLVCV